MRFQYIFCLFACHVWKVERRHGSRNMGLANKTRPEGTPRKEIFRIVQLSAAFKSHLPSQHLLDFLFLLHLQHILIP